MYKQAKKLKIMASHLYNSRLNGKLFIADLNIIATSRCNLNCPMCNSGLSDRKSNNDFTISCFRDYLNKLSSLHIPICSISGGEPTLAADLPYIIEEAARVFPIEVILFSNFYGDTHTIQPAIESALKNNAHIVCSFDGFGQVGDYLRGGSNVPNVILKHIEMTTKMKALMNSSSILEIHTVVCNQNVSHMGAILDMSKVYGWVQTIAPVNHFYYLKNNGNLPGLTCTPQLKNVLNLATMANNLKQMPSFTKGILDYANGTHKKYCPYDERSPINKFKIFLQADGNISLCDRTPLGNINQTTLEEIFKSKDYNDYLQRIKTCPGCWLSCFTEPALAMKPTNYLEVFRRL